MAQVDVEEPAEAPDADPVEEGHGLELLERSLSAGGEDGLPLDAVPGGRTREPDRRTGKADTCVVRPDPLRIATPILHDAGAAVPGDGGPGARMGKSRGLGGLWAYEAWTPGALTPEARR